MPGDVFNFNDDEIIEFTPEPGAKIEQIAPLISRMAKDMGMDAEIHFPAFTLEVPCGASPKDIIDAFHSVNVEYLPELRPTPKPPSRGPKFG
jgi:hypothetical protein